MKFEPLGIRPSRNLKNYPRSKSLIGFDDIIFEDRPSLAEYTSKTVITNAQLHTIISILVNLSLSLLPLYARDSEDESITRVLI